MTLKISREGGLNNNLTPNPQPFPQPQFTSGKDDDGDIILVQDKKSKKPLIIAIAAILIVTIISVIIFFILRSNNNSLTLEEYTDRYIDLLTGDEKLDEDALKESASDNIYNITHYTDPSSKEAANYYNELINTLSEMKEGVLKESFSEEEKERLESLLDDSLNLLPLYFISTALVYTNGSYNYFMEHKSFDGFLASYGYPIDEFEEGSMLKIFGMAINQAYGLNETYYDAVMKSGCMKNNGNRSYIDNVCLRDKTEISEINNNRMEMWRVLGNYDDMILDIIVADAKKIKEIIIMEGV